ncbi:MAG: UvrB/UvrC motif-containing protein [Planctomycetota bacterium]
MGNDIDNILQQWPFDPQSVNVRMLEVASRQVLQMRVDMGVLQMEIEGRPDGVDFGGSKTYFDFLKQRSMDSRDVFELDEDNCMEIDREFVQFYHRRVCWLQLKEFSNAVRDADHTLGLMDFCKAYSPDEEWTVSHEQYRPFVLYHRTQAAALSHLDEDAEPEDVDSVDVEAAIDEVNVGLARLHELFVEYDAVEQYEEDDLVVRLREFREGIRQKYDVELTLQEQLVEAIDNEDYEKAAQIRDALSKR